MFHFLPPEARIPTANSETGIMTELPKDGSCGPSTPGVGDVCISVEECCICQDALWPNGGPSSCECNKIALTLACGHMFHDWCIRAWREHASGAMSGGVRCPMCRAVDTVELTRSHAANSHDVMLGPGSVQPSDGMDAQAHPMQLAADDSWCDEVWRQARHGTMGEARNSGAEQELAVSDAAAAEIYEARQLRWRNVAACLTSIFIAAMGCLVVVDAMLGPAEWEECPGCR